MNVKRNVGDLKTPKSQNQNKNKNDNISKNKQYI